MKKITIYIPKELWEDIRDIRHSTNEEFKTSFFYLKLIQTGLKNFETNNFIKEIKK